MARREEAARGRGWEALKGVLHQKLRERLPFWQPSLRSLVDSAAARQEVRDVVGALIEAENPLLTARETEQLVNELIALAFPQAPPSGDGPPQAG